MTHRGKHQRHRVTSGWGHQAAALGPLFHCLRWGDLSVNHLLGHTVVTHGEGEGFAFGVDVVDGVLTAVERDRDSLVLVLLPGVGTHAIRSLNEEPA